MEESEFKDVYTMLLNYRKDDSVKVLYRYFEEKSFLEILHVDRKENYHSHFLKWLFEDPGTFAIANENLLYLLIKRSGHQKDSHFPETIKRSLLVGNFTVNYAKVKLEDKVKDGRSDIFIEVNYQLNDTNAKNLYVVIENKVYSDEHNVGKSEISQTTSYYNHYKKLYGEENLIFVYLTPIDSATLNSYDNAECDCKIYIQVNYQDLLDNILLPLSKDESIQPRKRFILDEYIKGLSINFSQNSSIMAMSEDLRKLLEDFWTNNQELIELSIYARSQDPLASDEELETFKELKNQIEKLDGKGSGRDNTHYSINGEGDYGKGSLVYEIIKKFVEKKGGMDITELQKTFPYNWRGKSDRLGNMIIIDQGRYDSEVKGNPSREWRWKELEMYSSVCYINMMWGDKEAMRGIIGLVKEIDALKDLDIKEKE